MKIARIMSPTPSVSVWQQKTIGSMFSIRLPIVSRIFQSLIGQLINFLHELIIKLPNLFRHETSNLLLSFPFLLLVTIRDATGPEMMPGPHDIIRRREPPHGLQPVPHCPLFCGFMLIGSLFLGLFLPLVLLPGGLGAGAFFVLVEVA